jgi:HicB family
MDLRPYVERLHHDLTNVAAGAGDEAGAVAERLLLALDPALRMALMEALADAAAEITSELDGDLVDVRLRGSEPQFVVVPGAGAAAPPVGTGPSGLADDHDDHDTHDGDGDDTDDAMARLTVRLPERLKARAEQAASAAGVSLNSWIVDAVRIAAAAPAGSPAWSDRWPASAGRAGRGRRRVQGWAR